MRNFMNFSAVFRWAVLLGAPALVGAVGGWQAHIYFSQHQPIVEARAAFEQQKFDLAVRLAQLQLHQSAVPGTEPMLVIACSLASQQKWAEATKAFEQSVLKTPFEFALNARSLYHVGRIPDAVALISTGLKQFPSDSNLAELETRMLGFHHQTKEAIASAERLMRIEGKESTGCLLAGMIHFGANNYAAAAANLRRALAASPKLEGQSVDFPKTSPDDVNELIAESLLSTENANEALEFARAAYEMKPSARRAYLAAKGAEARRAWMEASHWAERVLSFEPKNIDAFVLRIDMALEQGAVADAENLLSTLAKNGDANDEKLRHSLNLARAKIAAARRIADAKSNRK